MELHLVFVDLIEALDKVKRSGLWKIFHKSDCPETLLQLIASFRVGMQARLQENADI